MAEDILHRIWLERSDMTLDFTKEIYNCTLVMIEDLCVCMANQPLQDNARCRPDNALCRPE